MRVDHVAVGWVKRLAAAPQVWVLVLGMIWLGIAATGLWVLWRYDNTPGAAAVAPDQWPALTTLVRAADRPTIVMLAHPHCTCTRASLGELAEAVARAQTTPTIYVLFMVPSNFPDGWENTDLWRLASSIPGVTVVRDAKGEHARHFGAETSGQTLLYDDRGTLVFSGGITGARAHPGDNPGRQALVALLNRQPAARRGTNVFGCPLFNIGS
jgi:hypothetical protein